MTFLSTAAVHRINIELSLYWLVNTVFIFAAPQALYVRMAVFGRDLNAVILS